jgi:hypothetical protein
MDAHFAVSLHADPPRKSKRVVAHSDHEREKGDQVSAYDHVVIVDEARACDMKVKT